MQSNFIEDHPESLVSSYLLYKYFLQTTTPNYTLAKQLLALMLKEQPRNGFLVRMQQQVEGLANTEKKAKGIYPLFSRHRH